MSKECYDNTITDFMKVLQQQYEDWKDKLVQLQKKEEELRKESTEGGMVTNLGKWFEAYCCRSEYQKEEENCKCYVLYKSSNAYWEEDNKLKIVFCASETYGWNEADANCIVDWNKFENEESPTIKGAAKFVYCLRKRLEGVSQKEIEKIYELLDEDNPIAIKALDEVMKKALFMNLQKWVSNRTEEKTVNIKNPMTNEDETDVFSVLSSADSGRLPEFLGLDDKKENKYRRGNQRYTLETIAHSDADIFIIGGQKSWVSLAGNGWINGLFNAEETKDYRKKLGYPEKNCFNLRSQDMFLYKRKIGDMEKKTLFVSLSHPSKISNKDKHWPPFNDEYIFRKVEDIVSRLT